MWKHILIFGFLSVVYATPVYENGITKKDIQLAEKQFASIVDLAQKEWGSEGSEIKERINSTYTRAIRSSYEKLEGEIESAMRSSTDYTFSKILPILNQYKKNGALLQCIDFQKTLSIIDEAVEKVLSNVHKCKWNVLYPISYDLSWIVLLASSPNSNITQLNAEGLKCTEVTNSTGILRCFNKVNEDVHLANEGMKFYLRNLDSSFNEKLPTGLRVLEECNTHINFAEVRKIQDEQFDRIEKCISNPSVLPTDNKNEENNEASADKDLLNSIVLHIEDGVKRGIDLYNSIDKENRVKLESSRDNLSIGEGSRVMKFIEKKWHDNGHANKNLSSFLKFNEYSHLQECTKDTSECSVTILFKSFNMAAFLEQILVDLDASINVKTYLPILNEQSKACKKNLKNIDNSHDAVQCILRVDGRAMNAFAQEIPRLHVVHNVMREKLENQLSDIESCIPEVPSFNRIDEVKSCFARLYNRKSKIIFKL